MKSYWTLYTNGRVYTSHPVLAAKKDSILVAKERIVMVGAEAQLRRMAPDDLEQVDLEGAAVFPGFCDAHLHLKAYGQSLRRLRFGATDGVEQMAAAVAARAAQTPPGMWIIGRGWPGSLLHASPPTDWSPLEQSARAHPVALYSHDGHSLWLGPAARQALGLAAGQAVLRETACLEATGRIPDGGPEEVREDVLAAQRALLARGITAVHNFEGLVDFPLYQQLLQRGELVLQVLLNLNNGEQALAISTGVHTGFGDEKLRIGYVKFFLDGALGSRTALLRAPYDDTGRTGEQLVDEQTLSEQLGRLLSRGLVPAMHAIGDGAIALALDALQRQPSASKSRYRPRLEHAELFPADLLDQASKLDVVCSVQPTHLFDDIDLAGPALGARQADLLPLARLRAAGMRMQFGSDAPVVDPDPLATVYAASTRTRRDGTPAGGWQPEQRISRAEAIAQQLAGVLATGAPANFVAYAEDPLEAPDEHLLELRPWLVVAGGRVVHGGER